ncbi:MAG: glycosyltransferase [Candidatus Symbiothrix sp.]|jgi:glycosyltransferase involved in cell wall biosynthesis|nr:glycosyltransferase [Candidatus Symbiothrix sp.]
MEYQKCKFFYVGRIGYIKGIHLLLEKKPVIATRCGGPEMQIEDHVNGLLIEPNSVDELQNAMQWMLDHPIEVRKMSENADKHVVSMEDHVKNLINIYEKASLHGYKFNILHSKREKISKKSTIIGIFL